MKPEPHNAMGESTIVTIVHYYSSLIVKKIMKIILLEQVCGCMNIMMFSCECVYNGNGFRIGGYNHRGKFFVNFGCEYGSNLLIISFIQMVGEIIK